jgi:hypothetical protein
MDTGQADARTAAVGLGQEVPAVAGMEGRDLQPGYCSSP